MKKTYFLITIASLILTACNKTENPFLISKHNVGLLTDSTKVKDLEAIFANDSIVKTIAGDEFTGRINDIEIFEKGGKHLLSLTPSQSLDSTATIKTVKIMDSRFKTTKGINTLSTFGELQKSHTISSIQNTINNVVLFIKEENAFFTIAKDELPAELKFNLNTKIEAIQIPETAKIKYFMIGW